MPRHDEVPIFKADESDPSIVNVNPEWLRQLEELDPAAINRRAYFLSGPTIAPNVRCNAQVCQMPTRAAEMIDLFLQKKTYEPMLFCYFCNDTFHLKCAGLTLESMQAETLPIRCFSCKVYLKNPRARAYFTESHYNRKMIERRKIFLKASSLDAADRGFGSEDEFDEEDLNAFCSRKPADQSAYETASQGIDTKELKEQVTKILSDALPSILSNLSTSGINARANSTAIGNAPSTSFNFTTFYNNNTKKPDCEKRHTQFNYNPTAPPTINIEQSASQLSDCDLSTLLSRLVVSQEQTLNQQALANRRKVMPKITEFDGDPSKWLEFSQDVERYKKACQYDDETVKGLLRGALKGDAFEAVKNVFDFISLEQIMQSLRSDFGKPMTLVKRAAAELQDTDIPNRIYREDAIKLKNKIQSYFAACSYAQLGYMNSNQLGDFIYEKLPWDDKGRCKEVFVRNHPNAEIVICLQAIHEYLIERIPMLDEKPKGKNENTKRDDKKTRTNQVQYTQSNAASDKPDSTDKSGWRFQLHTKEASPYMGYDMQKVNKLKRECVICNRNGHFALQCNQYMPLNETQRYDMVLNKKLCMNCILTDTHTAQQCDLKQGCGYIMSRATRCVGKHHVSIHKVILASGAITSTPRNAQNKWKPKKGNTNKNTERARKAFGEASKPSSSVANVSQEEEIDPPQATLPAPTQANFHSMNPRQYTLRQSTNLTGVTQVNLHSRAFQKTVKMFKHDFVGPKGIVTAFSVGDSAAEVTLVREDLRQALGISGVPESLNMSWTDNTTKVCMATKFDLVVQGILDSSERLILRDCYAIDDLNLPPRTLNMAVMKQKFPYLSGVEFDGYEEEQPVMLIGSPHAFAIESIKELIEGGTGNPVAIESKLGISVYGGNPDESTPDNAYLQATAQDESMVDEPIEAHSTISNEELYDLLKKFNSIESVGIKAPDYYLIEDERKAVQILREEMSILDDGTVEVPLIWNRDKDNKIPKLDNNFSMAYKRQLALEKKLSKNPLQLEAYNKNVKELIELGYMRQADERDLNGKWDNVWYLPMGLVVNANKDPPKMRNVYDARSRYNNQSLNDLLLKGQDLLISLVKPLIRLRMNKVAFCADIQQMFHRMQICLRDQQCQRILWREDPSMPMKTMILKVMAFGPKCSPFVSQFVKNWNADNWAMAYPQASKAAKELVYMDDALISQPSVREASRLAQQLIEMFSHINWNLVSFQSNSVEFLKSLPGGHVKKDLIPMMTSESDEHVTKVLGCSWNTTEDAFVFQLDKNIFVRLMTEVEHKPTKKDLASLVARIFDVMGFIAHYVIRGKILLQRTWKLKIDWNDKIPDELHEEWKRWLIDIQDIAKLKIPRRLSNLNALAQADKLELHCFCDAGTEAFGAAVYLVTHSKDAVTSRLVMAKAKVTPIRFHTETEIKEIPRLELSSALIAARLSQTVHDALKDLPMTKFFWSDSEIVLRWILNPNHRLLKYAVGPIEEILELTDRNAWRYVPSVLNSADTCTKFKRFDFSDSNSIWFTGPEFIRKDQSEWPQLPTKLIMKESTLMYNIYTQRMIYSTYVLPGADFDIFIDKYKPSLHTSWAKLRRAVARGLKLFMDGFVTLFKSKQFENDILIAEVKRLNNNFKVLLPTDYERAEHFLFRKIQRECYPDEYKALKSGHSVKNKEFQRLNVFLDPQGIIRINSRVNLNDLSFPQQYAPVLPRKSELVYALLRHYHLKYDHIAIESQIAEIRTRCWIPKLRQALKVTKSRCNECKLRDTKMYEPMMAPLPSFRTDPTQRPFDVVALDCFGPYMVKCSGRFKKIWILLFCCTLTRFVHMHILESLESLRVLEAITLFWEAHGPIAKFVSDNGVNFVGAARILKEDYENSKLFLQKPHAALAPKLSEQYLVEWEFIPPYSPWMGGVYERLIKEAKRALYAILNKRKIEKIELSIAISEVSHRMNLRPLTYNPLDAEDGRIYTPHLLATNKDGWPLLPGIHKGTYQKINDNDIYRKGRAVADLIMAKFTAHYLPEYTRRTKWHKDKRDVKVDDLVLIIEPRDTRKHWTRGRIVKIRPSKDGRGRKADVLLGDGRIKLCSVRNLARLDVSI